MVSSQFDKVVKETHMERNPSATSGLRLVQTQTRLLMINVEVAIKAADLEIPY